jgi:FkbM family methyltransferase
MSYSQREEEIVITNYFEGFTGTLLDLGSNNGIIFSNSRALIEKGWSGCLVEPCQKTFTELVINNAKYPKAWCRNVAIGTFNGHADFYESGSLINGHDHSLVSTLKAEETERWKKVNGPDQHAVEYRKTKVHVVDWKTFHRSAPHKQFDFITIDIEGMELEVLRQMNLVDLGCKLICIEYNNKNQEEFDSLIPFPLVYKNRTNLIYGKRNS